MFLCIIIHVGGGDNHTTTTHAFSIRIKKKIDPPSPIMEDAMHVALTLSSLVYVITSIGKTLYASVVAKEDEEHKLVAEAVYHVWVTYVRDMRRNGLWTEVQRAEARVRALEYVRENRSRLCGCFGAPRTRLVSWINDAVARNKYGCGRRRGAGGGRRRGGGDGDGFVNL